MVRYFPSDDTSALPTRFGFWPGDPTTPGVVSTPFFSARLPVVCRQLHDKKPFGMFRGEDGMNYTFSTFLIEAVLIIFFIKVVSFLLRPLRQPRIVCEIIGGIMIGPSMFGRSRNFNYYLFPPVGNYICANLGLMGFFYFLFLTAAKTDVAEIFKAPRKHKYIAAISVLVPIACVGGTGAALKDTMDEKLQKSSSIGGVTFALGFTSFPVIYTVLRDMNLLNSEVGKFAMSVTLLGDMVGLYVLVLFEAMTQADGGGGVYSVIWFLISVSILAAFLLLVVRQSFDWIVAKTPERKLVNQNYIVIILMGVLVSGFLTDMFGMAIAVGPIWLGLVVPHGPPLTSTLAIRSETFVNEFLMPFSFALVGQKTNVNLLSEETWPKQVSPLVYMSIVGFVTKFISSTGAALFFKVPTRDSLTLGLMMNLRAPLISFLYDPSRPYRSSKHRTIQHTPQCTEMGLVLAVSDHETFSGLVTFLDFAYPTKNSPLSIFAIQLMELAGRAQPLFIEHEKRRKEEEKYEMEEEEHERSRSKRIDQLQSAFKLYQEKRGECVTLRAYTAHAPKRHMYQDICELALNKKTAFILLPYQKERLEDASLTELRDSGMLSVNADVLAHTPCSVCIYYEKGRLKNAMARSSMDIQHTTHSSHRRQEMYRFVILFLGGADNREALHLADRMKENPNITLTVVRFLAYNHEGEDEREKKLDDGVVTWFWVKNESNDRVSYKEVVVKNGAETLAAIQAMNVNDYDLWITGRREGINPKILEGLSTWSEDHQLGVIGDTVAGSVFASEGSVLVVQQQVRNQKGGDGFLNGKFDYKHLVSPWSHSHN
ncbi:cation/H(+) antiporter 25 isoform X2 [Capsella rubella]|uniref:cation/H(+) antiporter 25 isoform X2 n=1 Tax=Capsella rubella TaxID=81985 RepID=UPI000CD4E5F4|nr:cation/H(+) antiporter 25 isoform X2 [Capsella rubella]